MHRSSADYAKASLRTELLVPLVAGQFALEAALADLGNADPAIRARLGSQLSLIAGLRQQIATAQGGVLSALKAEVTALASTATAAAQDARTGASAASGLAATTAALAFGARGQVTAVMAGMKDFDPYLRFGPGDPEAEYRQREAERRAVIAAEQAKGTPQGDLNASGAAAGQMADAAAHGAGSSPEFQSRFGKLAQSTQALRAQLIRDGKDVSQFDDHLRDDLRRIMTAKGVPEAKINALLAAHVDNPLDAVKAFVAEHKGVIGEREITDLSRKVQEDRDNARVAPVTVAAADPASPMVDAMARFKAAGVVVTDHDAGTAPVHGVSARSSADQGQSAVRNF